MTSARALSACATWKVIAMSSVCCHKCMENEQALFEGCVRTTLKFYIWLLQNGFGTLTFWKKKRWICVGVKHWVNCQCVSLWAFVPACTRTDDDQTYLIEAWCLAAGEGGVHGAVALGYSKHIDEWTLFVNRLFVHVMGSLLNMWWLWNWRLVFGHVCQPALEQRMTKLVWLRLVA